jgi:hypothetical protein
MGQVTRAREGLQLGHVLLKSACLSSHMGEYETADNGGQFTADTHSASRRDLD